MRPKPLVYQHMLRDRPDPDRSLNGNPLWYVLEKLATRLINESGGSMIKAVADIRAATDKVLAGEIKRRTAAGEVTWAEVGRALGVSAQAAHQKYARERSPSKQRHS